MNDEKTSRLATRRKPNQKRRRRSESDDYSSSSGGDDDGPKKNPNRVPLGRQGNKSQPQQQEEEGHPQAPSSSSSLLYRDRARERREGPRCVEDKNHSNNDQEQDESTDAAIFDQVVAAWESGDPRQSNALRGPELQQQQYQADDLATPASTWTEALNRLERLPPTSNLGKELLPFLRQQQQQHRLPDGSTTTAAAAATPTKWRPSILTFSCNSAATHRAWDLPMERTTDTDVLDDDSVLFLKGTLCTPSLLAAMEQSLARAQQALLLQKQKRPHKTRSSTSSSITKSVPHQAKETNVCENSAELDEDEDDDIFGGVGEYDGVTACLIVPPPVNGDDSSAAVTLTHADTSTSTTVKEPGSLISDNGTRQQAKTKETVAATTTTMAGLFATDTHQASAAHAGTTSSNNTSSRLVGFASSSSSHQHSLYDGLDGIGMDFDGRDYEDEEEDAKKPKKKKRRKKGHDSDDD